MVTLDVFKLDPTEPQWQSHFVANAILTTSQLLQRDWEHSRISRKNKAFLVVSGARNEVVHYSQTRFRRVVSFGTGVRHVNPEKRHPT